MRIFLWFVMFATTASADGMSVTPCPTIDPPDPDAMTARVACLETQQAELLEVIEVLRMSQRDLANSLAQEALRLDHKIDGPEKVVQVVAAEKRAVTISNWSNGANKRVFNCVSALTSREGMTLVGGALGAKVRLGLQNWSDYGGPAGCAPSPHCDSAGEFCEIQARAAGCYVNTAWHTWYVGAQNARGLPILQSEICEG